MQIILVYGNANEFRSLEIQLIIALWTMNCFASTRTFISDSWLPIRVCSLNSSPNLFLHFTGFLIN